MNIGFFSAVIFTQKGGIERFASRLSAWLAGRGHRFFIYGLEPGNGVPQYPLALGVQTRALMEKPQPSFKALRERIINDNLDVFCVANSGNARIMLLQLLNNTKIPIIISERASPGAVEALYLKRRERLATFFGAEVIHLLSEKYLDSVPVFLHERVTVIPNPCPALVPIDWEQRRRPRKAILAVSRLEEEQKRLTLLISAFARLAQRFPEWDLRICGEGISRPEYEELIKSYGLTARIMLLGEVNDMEPEYVGASIFCMPSAFEGSPNALLEAQSYGLPAVGFADCAGVNDIIIDVENGALLKHRDPEALAEGLARLMADEKLRERYGQGAQRLAARFDEEDIFSRWEVMLAKAAACKPNTRLNYAILPESEEDASLCLHNLLSAPSPFESNIRESNMRGSNIARTLRTRVLMQSQSHRQHT